MEGIKIRCSQGFDSLAGTAGTGYIGQGRGPRELHEVHIVDCWRTLRGTACLFPGSHISQKHTCFFSGSRSVSAHTKPFSPWHLCPFLGWVICNPLSRKQQPPGINNSAPTPSKSVSESPRCLRSPLRGPRWAGCPVTLCTCRASSCASRREAVHATVARLNE